MSDDGATGPMATLDSNCRAVGGVTLVELCVTATEQRQVRIENCLDGPVWPPRSEGVPEPGWDEEGYEGQVGPDGRLLLGYASPAEPAEPPAEIAAEREPESTASPQAVLKALGTGTPPRAAMPGTDARADPDGSAADRAGDPAGKPARADERSVGEPAADWFGGVERRLARAERLAEVDSAEAAAAAVERAGGVDAVRTLRERLAADRATLARLECRCSELRERAEAVEVPADALARLA